jgi:cobalt-zinc-cadmium efflux system membrane fusion protein
MAALLFSGCGTGPAPTVEAVAPKEAPPAASPQTVTLDIAAQKLAGVQTVLVVSRAVAETLRVTGRITINDDRAWRVGAITDGTVMKVLAKVGDRVTAGQVLASMHSHDVHESRAVYEKAQKEVVRLRAAEEQAKRMRDRARKLHELKANSREQLEQAETEHQNAQSLLEQAVIEATRAKIHLVDYLGVAAEEPEHHRPGSHGEEDLIPIRVPQAATGVVLERHVTEGTVLQPGGLAFVIADLNTVWLVAAVPEQHLTRTPVGIPVRVTVQAYGDRTFSGRITRLGAQLDPAMRTVQARVELANPSGQLKPEMYAEAELDLPGRRTAIEIPDTAVQEVKGSRVVFVRRAPITFEAVMVEQGRTRDGRVEILHGLRPGEEIVVQGAFILKSQLLKSALAEE